MIELKRKHNYNSIIEMPRYCHPIYPTQIEEQENILEHYKKYKKNGPFEYLSIKTYKKELLISN
jgi:hypothetical protein